MYYTLAICYYKLHNILNNDNSICDLINKKKNSIKYNL